MTAVPGQTRTACLPATVKARMDTVLQGQKAGSQRLRNSGLRHEKRQLSQTAALTGWLIDELLQARSALDSSPS